MRVEIRRATSTDSERATELAARAKAHWGYSAEWMSTWRDDLVITPAAIESHRTFVACVDGAVVGMCQLQESDLGAVLEHVWVEPELHRHGIGRALVERARAEVQGVIAIVADPHAEEFYLRLGARRVGEVAAPMPGAPDRTLPLLEMD